MARWITKTIGGVEVLRVREGQQFEWADVIYPSDFAAAHSDEQIGTMGFTVEHLADVAPVAPGMPLIASRLQFFRALARRDLISQSEAMAALTVSAIPARLLAAIDSLPAGERFDAALDVAGLAEFDRARPLVEKICLALMGAEEIAGFFAFARTL